MLLAYPLSGRSQHRRNFPPKLVGEESSNPSHAVARGVDMQPPGITSNLCGSVSQAAISRAKIPYPNQPISSYYYEAQAKAEIFAYGKTFQKAGRESGCHFCTTCLQ